MRTEGAVHGAWFGVLLAACVGAACWPVPACAGSGGTASGAMAGVGGSARMLAMGGAGIAGMAEAGAIWVNPARLAGLSTPELGFMHGMYVEGVTLEQLAVAGPTKLGVFGGGITLMRMGDLESYDATGMSAGTISPGEQEFSAGWAWPGGMWSAGAAVKYYRSQLASDAHASAFAGDAGISVTPAPIITLAAAVQHLGTELDYGGGGASLPMTIRGGAAVKLADLGLVVAADGVMPSDGELSVRVGAEKDFAIRSDVTASVRAGYRTGAPAGGVAGLAAGAGVYWHPADGFDTAAGGRYESGAQSYPVRGVRFAYAWTPMGELGDAHWISVSLGF